MSQEIIYTSSPRGLRPGSRGFCTVASTSGMPKTLAERLESLSGYRHLYQPIDPNAHLNPIAWSHLIMLVGGQKYHVLSRVADAGLDYSHRSNKLAHHVALLTPELTAPGPAWSLSQPGLMETTWSGEPRILPAGRSLPSGGLEPRVCRAWEQCKGDAGWAGIVAEAILKTPQRRVFLVFRPGMDLLPLLAEAEALLPSAARWQFTFSTYYASLPADADCRCRGVLADTPDALSAKRQPGALIIDLCAGNEPAPQTAAAEAARVGVALEVTASPRVEQRTPAETAPSVTDGPWEAAAKSGRIAAVGPLPRVSRPPELAPPPVPPPRRIRFGSPSTDLQVEPSWTRFLVSASLFALFGAVMFGLGYFLALSRSNSPLEQTVQVSDQSGSDPGAPTPTGQFPAETDGGGKVEKAADDEMSEGEETVSGRSQPAAEPQNEPSATDASATTDTTTSGSDSSRPEKVNRDVTALETGTSDAAARDSRGHAPGSPSGGTESLPPNAGSSDEGQKKKPTAAPVESRDGDKASTHSSPAVGGHGAAESPFVDLPTWWEPPPLGSGELHGTKEWPVLNFRQPIDRQTFFMDIFLLRPGNSSLRIEQGSDKSVWMVSHDDKPPKEIAEFSLRTDDGGTSLLKFRWCGDQDQKSLKLLSSYALIMKTAGGKFAHAVRLSRPEPAKQVTLEASQEYQFSEKFAGLELQEVAIPLSEHYQHSVENGGRTWKFVLHPNPPVYWIVELDDSPKGVGNCTVSARLEYDRNSVGRANVYKYLKELDDYLSTVTSASTSSQSQDQRSWQRPADTLGKDLKKGCETKEIKYSIYGRLHGNAVAIPLVVDQ